MTSGILRDRNLDRALRGWFISAPWYRKSQLARLEELGVTLMPGTRNCLQASLLIFGAWTGMSRRLNWAGTLNMAFPCSSGFSFTRSGFLRENALRASIWRGNVQKKNQVKKTALPILTSLRSTQCPSHHISLVTNESLKPTQIQGERELDSTCWWGRGKVILQKSKLDGTCYGCFWKIQFSADIIWSFWKRARWLYLYNMCLRSQALHHANKRWITLNCCIFEMLPFFIFIRML